MNDSVRLHLATVLSGLTTAFTLHESTLPWVQASSGLVFFLLACGYALPLGSVEQRGNGADSHEQEWNEDE